MAEDFDTDEGFEPLPTDAEPPEGLVELALQEDAADGDALEPTPAPQVLGRSYAFDFNSGRFIPEGRQPLPIAGRDALAQRVEKVMRDDRGAAAVHPIDYGMEGAYDLLDGSPFDGAAFAELEERISDAVLAIPGVQEVEDFNADGDIESDTAEVAFRVLPNEDPDDPIDFTGTVPLI